MIARNGPRRSTPCDLVIPVRRDNSVSVRIAGENASTTIRVGVGRGVVICLLAYARKASVVSRAREIFQLTRIHHSIRPHSLDTVSSPFCCCIVVYWTIAGVVCLMLGLNVGVVYAVLHLQILQ